jgi:hypothetical protein
VLVKTFAIADRGRGAFYNRAAFAAHDEPARPARFRRHLVHAALDAQRLQLADILVTAYLRACSAVARTIRSMLRVEVPALGQTARPRSAANGSPVAVFAALRSWKNEFR